MTMEEATYNDGAVYNCLDAVSRVSTYYGENCLKKANDHAKKARRGLIFTGVAALVGVAYSVYEFFTAGYYSGETVVYDRYSNMIDDSDKFEDEWISIVKAKKEKKDN